jgi:hypothetical protein
MVLLSSQFFYLERMAMFEQLTRAQNDTLKLVEVLTSKGCSPSGYPAVLPMWRVESGVEIDDETDELRAMRLALEGLRRSDPDASRLVLELAGGRAPGAADWMCAASALDELDAAVEGLLRG